MIPVPTVKGIDSSGVITIEWNVDMEVVKDLGSLTTDAGQGSPIKIELEPGSEYSLPEKLKLSDYKVFFWENRILKIQINI